MKKFMTSCTLLIISCFLIAQTGTLAQSDLLDDEEKYDEGFALVENYLKTVTTDSEKAECLWRLSRFQLRITELKEDDGMKAKEVLPLYEKGIEYAEESLAFKKTADGYYWRASNVGKWGQAKGILNSLFKAKPMKEDLLICLEYDQHYADAWYVLGKLYNALPGGIISFGDKNFAVSLARKSLAEYKKNDIKWSYYTDLAVNLHDRNWSVAKREKERTKGLENYNKETDVFEKNCYYESTLDFSKPAVYSTKSLKDLSDREEAVMIVEWLLRELKALKNPKRSERDKIDELNEYLEDWK